jgi:ElaB/YqjD/DUF883 family membrane-anchored ribosome-binding protein
VALSLDIAANTRQAQSQVKDLGKELDKVGGVLDDVARDGDKAGDKLESTFRDMGRDANDAGKKIKKGVGDGLKEAGSEAKSSGREAAASFSGEFDDVTDFVQETAANAFGGFGPIGAAAGLAAAAGIGLAGAELTKQQEQIDAMKQRYSDMYAQAAEDGLNYISTAQIIAQTNDLMFNPDRANEWKSIQEDAKQIGLDANTVALARNGHEESLNVVLAATADARDALKAKNEEAGWNAIRLSLDEQNALRGIQSEYENIKGVQDANQENLKNANAINAGLREAERDQIKRTQDADQARYEAMARNYNNPIKAKVEVDDSAIRNYRPPTISINTRLNRPGAVTWE